MRAVIQRVSSAGVSVDGEAIGAIGPGLLVLLGVKQGDTEADAAYLARKVASLRIFEDSTGRMNAGVAEVGGELLVVSQFTLYGDVRRGRRPSFAEAAPPDAAERLYEHFIQHARDEGVRVQTGRFGAKMAVSLVNDGPVTLLAESDRPSSP